MPLRKAEAPLEKKTLNLTKGDADILHQFYPQLGWSVAARQIIRKHCKALEERANKEGIEEDDGQPIDIDEQPLTDTDGDTTGTDKA